MLRDMGVSTEAGLPHRLRSSMVHDLEGDNAWDAPAPPQKKAAISKMSVS